jgi:hypothetical protein
MNALQARGIRKSFRRRQVLAGLDMDVPAGKLIHAQTPFSSARQDPAATKINLSIVHLDRCRPI